jgi:hypothetical protein
MTPFEIEPVTFRLLAHCPNQLCQFVARTSAVMSRIKPATCSIQSYLSWVNHLTTFLHQD